MRTADHRLVRIHVDDGSDADARRLDDVDGMDAEAWTDMAERGGIIRWHVARDDDGDDAAVVGAHTVALSPAVGKADDIRLSWLTALVVIGYFFVWTVFGIVVFPLGAALAEIEMQRPTLARVVPIAVGVVVMIASALQFSAWKAHHLACCREPSRCKRTLPTDAATAGRHGLRLGLHCIYGCAGFTVILLVIGIMDVRLMALVTAAITAERLASNGERVARAIGIVVVGVGLLLIARAAAGLG
jgi:predicted metal-binding membrane protein